MAFTLGRFYCLPSSGVTWRLGEGTAIRNDLEQAARRSRPRLVGPGAGKGTGSRSPNGLSLRRRFIALGGRLENAPEFVDNLMSALFAGSELQIERLKDYPRPVEL